MDLFNESKLLTVKQSAERLGAHANFVCREIRRGKLRAVKLTTKFVRVRPADRKCCKDLILPKNPVFARKPPCLSASQSTTGFSAKSRKRGVFRQNRKVATLPLKSPANSKFT